MVLAGWLGAGCLGSMGGGTMDDDAATGGTGVGGDDFSTSVAGGVATGGGGGDAGGGGSGGASSANGGGGAGGGPPPPDTFCTGTNVMLKEPLSTGSVSGQPSGGQFVADGWRTAATSDQISWDLGQGVPSGSLELEVKGLHPNVSGCLSGVCYYVGIFEEPSGDKYGDYTGSAFVESRYHNNQQENFHDTFKIQTGTGTGDMSEPMVTPGTLGWQPGEWHSVRIEWGAGQGRLYLDGNHALTSSYGGSPNIPWRYLFLGTTNYKGMGWAAVDVTYRNLCLRSQ
jgi:hypothetical protein